jgi:2-polyprenyl-3-methyl-5-hydroxy-6-metoxy-1,4-benzoquinol methylase
MSYDWNRKIKHHRFSLPWFDELDRRFIHSARLYGTNVQPFDRIIPFEALHGRDVLEIGCGMGLHTELMTRAGAMVTALDLSATSVEATTQRLALKGITADVRQGDAEELPFPDTRFDFVWSWGVIHHSSRSAKIVREIARVLRPGGECRIMVYNRQGMAARVAFIKDHLLKLGFLRGTFDQTLHRSTDGFSARHYVQDQFEDLFRAFFREVSCEVCGQESDAIPLPSFLRRLAVRLVSEAWLRRRQARCGSFLFLRARQPFA